MSRALLAACAMAALVAACESPRTQLDPDDIRFVARKLAGLASEASLLAGALQDAKVTENYAWVHQQSLRDESLELTQQLAKPAPDRLRESQARLTRLNTRLQADVTRVAPASGDAQRLRALRSEFDDVSREAGALQAAR